MSHIYTIQNREMTLSLHPGQMEAWDSKARFTFVVAGTQSGKTSFGPLWLYKEILDRGPGDYIAVSATYDLFKLKMLPEMLMLFQDVFKWQYQKSERILTRSDGCRIILRSAESDGGLESATAKGAWLDECGLDRFTIDAWEAVQRRLSLHSGRVLGTTTPYNMGWLKREIYDRWAAGDPNYRVIQFKSLMNPVFPVSEYNRAKSVMPDWKFRMFYDGEFTRPAGMIYSDFNESTMVIDDFNVPPTWNVTIGIDPGAVNTAVIWIATDPASGKHFIVSESLDGEKTSRQHVSGIMAHPAYRHGSKAYGGAESEKQFRADFIDAGLPVEAPGISDVEAGIDRVIQLIKTDRLRVFRSCKGVLSEFGAYSRVCNDQGEPTEKIKDKETYHRLDALRYAVVGLSRPAIIIPIATLGDVRPR